MLWDWDPPRGSPNSSRGGTQLSPKDWCIVWVLATACPAQTTTYYCLSFSGPSFLPIADDNPLLSVVLRIFLPSLLPSFLRMADNDPAGASIYMPRDGRPNSRSKSAVVRHMTLRACQSFGRWHFLIVSVFLFPGNFYLFVVFLGKTIGNVVEISIFLL